MIIHYNCTIGSFLFHSFLDSEKTPLPLSRLSRGAVYANAHARTHVIGAPSTKKKIGMLNQQKGVQQETAYSAVTVEPLLN